MLQHGATVFLRSIALFLLGLSIVFAANTPSLEGQCVATPRSEAQVREWARSIPIISAGPDGAREFGLGLVVGWQDTKHWIVTAAHVLTSGLTPDDAKSETRLPIQVDFPDQSGQWTLCEDRPVRYRIDADIAFVCVETKAPVLFHSELVARRIEATDEFRLLGERGVSTVTSPNSLRLRPHGQLKDLRADGRVTIGNDIGRGGDSGSPIWSDRGVAGLYLSRLNGSSNGISMSAVQRFASDARIPWKLNSATSFDCKYAREVCGAARTVGGQPVKLRLMREGDAGEIGIAHGQCTSVPEGPYRALSEAPIYSCPDTALFIGESKEPMRLSLQCSIRLEGVWGSDTASLSCVNLTSGATRCDGLMELGYGTFSGMGSVINDEVSLTGNFTMPFAAPQPASGKFQLVADRLEGSIAPNGKVAKKITLHHR